jgi:hypothetical protein
MAKQEVNHLLRALTRARLEKNTKAESYILTLLREGRK